MDKIQAPESAIKYAVYLKESTHGIRKIYLFGSYAKGTSTPDSDIDLAIVFDQLPNSFDMQLKLMKMRRNFDTRIEPHPFSAADFSPINPLVKEILLNGLEIA